MGKIHNKPGLKLALELDGYYRQTPEGKKHDRRRDQYFYNLGITTLRFENKWVFERSRDIADTHFEYKAKVVSERVNINDHANP
jgi:very-short-patch-repair endonuclease